MIENDRFDKYVLDNWFSRLNKVSATLPPFDDVDVTTAIFGLCEEAGEVAGKRKKMIRGDDITHEEHRAGVGLELGDTLFYLTFVANYYGFTLDDIAKILIEKLAGRKERGTRRGSGDDR